MALCIDDKSSLIDFVIHKGYGVKGLVESGISQVPNTFIQPPDQRIPTALQKIWEPIDLSKLDGPDHDLVVKAIVTAAETIGFLQVVNHGVPVELLDSLIASAYRFFDQPPQEKAVYLQGVSPSPLVSYGTSFLPEKDSGFGWRDYVGMKYIDDEQALQHWPKECREDALNYLNSSRKMVKSLIDVLLQNLGLPHDNTVVDSLIHPRAVNINLYPACPNPDLTVGIGGHTDLTNLTVLFQDGTGGLQVKLEEDIVDQALNKGQWIEISPVSGALIINIGDMLQILSNGQYRSAEHRVRTSKSESRVSAPLFILPLPTDKIGPLPHLVKRDGVCRFREIVYGDYLQDYYRSMLQGKKSLDLARIDHSA